MRTGRLGASADARLPDEVEDTTVVCCENVNILLPDAKALALAIAALPDWRRRKAEAFRFEADRRRSVAAWLLLQRMLKEWTLDADSLPVTENEYGKPVFNPSLGLHFNLSHAGERVMAAVSDRPVGCDVERIAAFDEAVAQACLTETELEWVLSFPSGPVRDRAFLRMWVRKEAYAKAIGVGFGIDLKSISVLPDRCPSGLRFRDLEFSDEYLGCVVSLTAKGSF